MESSPQQLHLPIGQQLLHLDKKGLCNNFKLLDQFQVCSGLCEPFGFPILQEDLVVFFGDEVSISLMISKKLRITSGDG